MQRWVPGLAALVALCLAVSAEATVLRRASLGELVQSSAVIFHGVVVHVDDDTSRGPDGPFRTSIDLEVLTPIKGLVKDTRVFSLELPGGRAGGRVMRIPGMPSFTPGDEVVLLLEATAQGHALAGLGQGVFRVVRHAGEARVVRELGDVMLLEHGRKVAGPTRAPATLAELLAAIGALVTP